MECHCQVLEILLKGLNNISTNNNINKNRQYLKLSKSLSLKVKLFVQSVYHQAKTKNKIFAQLTSVQEKG